MMTRDVFNQIAPSWYNFRHWSIFRSELEALAQRWQKGSLLNIGCAHGPDFLPFRQDFELYGIDFSREMLKFAQRYSRKFDFAVNLVLADAGYFPFPDGVFEAGIKAGWRSLYHRVEPLATQVLVQR